MTSVHVSNATADDFADVVVARSHRQPVLVDFWAAWCAPCRSLAPVVDALADKLDGALAVVKIDTDAEQALAGQFGVRSLPTLMLFRDGRAVGQLVGAQPLAALERFVQPHLPRPADSLLASADDARAGGDSAKAAELLEQALSISADDYRIHPRLADAYVDAGRLDEARKMLAELPANIAVDDGVRRVVARINLLEATSGDALDEVGGAYAAACAAAARADYDQAVPALIGLLGSHREWQDGAIRKTLLDIFNVLGTDSRVKPWRTQMARTLN